MVARERIKMGQLLFSGGALVDSYQPLLQGANDLSIHVGEEQRQNSNTDKLIFDCRKLIEYGSSFYTLYPGDVIMTGTPEGVGPVVPGDIMHCYCEGIGRMEVAVGSAG